MNSIDITTQTAKYLIDAFYGRPADHSYSSAVRRAAGRLWR